MQHRAICHAAFDGLPLGPALQGKHIPTGWDSEAICTNLYNASQGILPCWDVQVVSSGISEIVRQFRNGEIKKGCQSRAYKFIDSKIVSDWLTLFNRRALVLCVNSVYNKFVFEDSFLKNYSMISKRCSKTVNMSVLKTWSNSWATSSRTKSGKEHEAVLPCIFGCDGQIDDLSHYLACQPFWTLMGSALNLPLSYIDVDPVLKLNWVEPSMPRAQLLAVAFHCYNAFRIARKPLVAKCCQQGKFEEIHLILCDIAKHHGQELFPVANRPVET